jgi:hypothetical protein
MLMHLETHWVSITETATFYQSKVICLLRLSKVHYPWLSRMFAIESK